MANLTGGEGELRMTLEITRAATGKTETVELVGRLTTTDELPDEAGEQGEDHGSDPLDGRA